MTEAIIIKVVLAICACVVYGFSIHEILTREEDDEFFNF